MKTFGYISIFILCLLSLGACSDDLSGSAPLKDAEGQVKVVLYVPYAEGSDYTRANPEAGEDGNGRELGMENENEIHDVNLFFFKGSGLNPVSADVFVYGVFIPSMEGMGIHTESLDFEKKVTITFNAVDTPLADTDILAADSEVSFITVLNAGKDLYSEGMTLSQLRSLVMDDVNTWTSPSDGSNDASKCGHFVMTTAYDADEDGYVAIDGVARKVGAGRLVRNEKVGEVSSAEKPGWQGETTVQRMCARIDVMYGDNILTGGNDDANLVYPLVGKDSEGDLVHITNILPVNVMQTPSYLLTKTTDGIPSAWTEEGLGSFKWAGTEKMNSSKCPENYVIEPCTLLKEVGNSNVASWYGSSCKNEVSTSILDAAKGKVGSYFSSTLPSDPYYSGRGYTKMTVVGYANENIQSPGASTSDFLTGLAFRALYQPRVWTARNDGAWTETTMTDVQWRALSSKSFTLYSPTAGESDAKIRFFANYDEAVEYRNAHITEQAILTRYIDGICYYNLWIRHYNDIDDAIPSDPHRKLPMEYAIVRNNIYRVALTFSGPGDASPQMREPETMMARIFVRKWNLRVEPNELQF